MTTEVNPPLGALSQARLNTIQDQQNFLRDLLIFLNQLWTRTGGSSDLIADLEVTQVAEDGGNRSTRHLKDDIYEVETRLADLKRSHRCLEQAIYELQGIIGQTKSQNRTTEQKVNELEERLDSGT